MGESTVEDSVGPWTFGTEPVGNVRLHGVP